jgi:DNA-binding NarL/FixJ family response regulator
MNLEEQSPPISARMAVGGIAATPIRIVLVNDPRLFRDAIRSVLSREAELRIVGEAARIDDACATIEETRPDVVVVLDSFVSKAAGAAAVRNILRRTRDARILMVSLFVDDTRVAQALEAGVRGYLGTDQSFSELSRAIRAVASDGVYPVREAFVRNCLRRHAEPRATPIEALTSREREVFHLAVRGLSNQTMANQLSISRRTIETHRARILRKLRLHSAIEMVLFAAHNGLLEPSQRAAAAQD